MSKTVLFLCTGNSCRSQLAEAIVNARLSDEWRAFSAGTRPAGYVHPNALRALAEIGIHHQSRSKSVDEFHGQAFDLVVTVCDAAAEACPVWLGQGRRVHLGFPDPAKATGSDEEVMTVFRAVRDDIAQEIPALLAKEAAQASTPGGHSLQWRS
jgi:arsenate reductase